MGKLTGYYTADVQEALRVGLTPWNVSTYLPKATPLTDLDFPAGVETKISIPVSVADGSVPRGFDIYTTPQGTALRFIGSGLESGDEAWFVSQAHASLGSSNVATLLTLSARKRPYTEINFANSTQIGGFYIKRNQPNNDTGAVALVAPVFKLTAGDLLEISGNSTNGVTGVGISAFAFNIREIKI